MLTVYLIITAHNNKKEVLDLFACLERQTYKESKVILVDDGSSDDTEKEVLESYPETTILKGTGNLWWTGATVMGVDFVRKQMNDNDFILFLNNDLTVEKNYIETLVNSSIEHGRAITGSVLVDYDNHDFVESGVKLSNHLDLIVNRDANLILNTDYDLNVDALPGRGTLIPVEVFNKIGNLNKKKLPHYGADYEFSIRAKRAGFKLIVSNKAKVLAKLCITGVQPDLSRKFMSIRDCFTFLFSKKSKTNIFYYLNYVWLCSEKKYRFANAARSAISTLSKTVFRTIPFYPLRLVLNIVLFTVRFCLFVFDKSYKVLFKDYPVRVRDLEKYGLNRETLLKNNLLLIRPYRGINDYYSINIQNAATTEKLPLDERTRLSRLKEHSYSFAHKFDIIVGKINIIINKTSTE